MKFANRAKVPLTWATIKDVLKFYDVSAPAPLRTAGVPRTYSLTREVLHAQDVHVHRRLRLALEHRRDPRHRAALEQQLDRRLAHDDHLGEGKAVKGGDDEHDEAEAETGEPLTGSAPRTAQGDLGSPSR